MGSSISVSQTFAARHRPMVRRLPRAGAAARLLIALSLAAAGCDGSPGAARSQGPGSPDLHVGYFPNITHATALVGLEKGIFTRAPGSAIRLKTQVFNAGPAAVEALFSGAIDATYIGPNPAINAFVRSDGEAVRIVSGATSGGAFFVVKPEIRRPSDLKGRKVASPQLGNTQDVALRAWLADNGLKTDPRGGGDVSVLPQENAQTLETFRSGQIFGAWVPEPWATRLVLEAGGTVLVDERDLWPGGRFVTTSLIVRTAFLREHPDVVERLLRAHVEATDFVNEHPDEARLLADEAIAEVTTKKLPDEVIAGAWANLTFTVDPVASSLLKSAAGARALGFLPHADVAGIHDLSLLNKVLRDLGREEVRVE